MRRTAQRGRSPAGRLGKRSVDLDGKRELNVVPFPKVVLVMQPIKGGWTGGNSSCVTHFEIWEEKINAQQPQVTHRRVRTCLDREEAQVLKQPAALGRVSFSPGLGLS